MTNICRGCARIRRVIGLGRRRADDGIHQVGGMFPDGLTIKMRAFHLSMAMAVLAFAVALIWAGAKSTAWMAIWAGNLLLGQ